MDDNRMTPCDRCPVNAEFSRCVAIQGKHRIQVICNSVNPEHPQWKPGFEPNVIAMSEQSRTAHVDPPDFHSQWRGPEHLAPPGWKRPPKDRDDPFDPPGKPDEPGNPNPDMPGLPGETGRDPQPLQASGTAVPERPVLKTHPDDNTHESIYKAALDCPHKKKKEACCGPIEYCADGRYPGSIVTIGVCYPCQAAIKGIELP